MNTTYVCFDKNKEGYKSQFVSRPLDVEIILTRSRYNFLHLPSVVKKPLELTFDRDTITVRSSLPVGRQVILAFVNEMRKR